jgi:hypothetical protein
MQTLRRKRAVEGAAGKKKASTAEGRLNAEIGSNERAVSEVVKTAGDRRKKY